MIKSGGIRRRRLRVKRIWNSSKNGVENRMVGWGVGFGRKMKSLVWGMFSWRWWWMR